jgi:hypothetical protein
VSDSSGAAPPAAQAPLWRPEWLAEAEERSANAWRGVEAQHIVATMRLVDTLDEQAVLEQVLEGSKPALPGGAAPSPSPSPARAAGPHYLLATPFRYRSPFPSRFRRSHTAGVWYGAESLQAAAAEVAYWRWRFIVDSDGLRGGELRTQHSFFQARVRGRAVDLSQAPWRALREHWTRDRDYSATHALGDAARAAGVDWLRYESVRQPGGVCAAVFHVEALALHQPQSQQTWHCKTTACSVWMVHDQDRLAWAFRP